MKKMFLFILFLTIALPFVLAENSDNKIEITKYDFNSKNPQVGEDLIIKIYAKNTMNTGISSVRLYVIDQDGWGNYNVTNFEADESKEVTVKLAVTGHHSTYNPHKFTIYFVDQEKENSPVISNIINKTLLVGKPSCVDSDEKDYYVKGKTVDDVVSFVNPGVGYVEDQCSGQNTLLEYSCFFFEENTWDDGTFWPAGNYSSAIEYNCPFGCENGACIGNKEEVKPNNEPLAIPERDESKRVDYVCGGCKLDNKCYPFGYRKDGTYCLDNSQFVVQLETGASCDNNFQCSSNVCVSGKCISPSLIDRILDWFRRLFGGE